MSALNNTRYLALDIISHIHDDDIYFKRYLNDLEVLENPALQIINTAAIGTEDDEVYFRRYLNDIS